MRLIEINKKEFENFCKESMQDNFFQSKYFAQIERKEGYHTYFLGLEQDGIIRACCMLLSKNVSIFGKRVFYAPRGFIIDYRDEKLLNIFTIAIKDFAKEKKGIYIKIDPNVMYHDRNFSGDLIEGGLNNSKAVENLTNLGWKKIDNPDYLLKPSFLYKLNLKGKNEEEIFNDFDLSLQEIIKRNSSIGITTYPLKKEEYNKYLDMMINNNNVINYLDLNKNNFKNIIDILSQHNLLRISISELDIDEYLKSTIESKNNIGNNPSLIEKLDKQIETIKNMQYKYGHKIMLGGVLSVIYNNEYLVLGTVVIDKFNNFNPLSSCFYEEIKFAKKNGIEVFNFNGIGNSLVNNKLLNDYKMYNGKVIELIGEYNYVLRTIAYKREMKKLANKNRY